MIEFIQALVLITMGVDESSLDLMPGGNIAQPWQLSADGERLICALEALDVRTGDRIAAFPAKSSWFDFSVDESGDRIAIRGPADSVEVWDTRSCRRILRLGGPHFGPMLLSADGALLMTCDDAKDHGPIFHTASGLTVDLDPSLFIPTSRFPKATGPVRCDRSLRRTSEGDLILWDAETGGERWRVRMPKPTEKGIGLSPQGHMSRLSEDGSRWLRAFSDDSARVVDTSTGESVGSPLALGSATEPIAAAQISSDGSRAMVVGAGRVSIRDLPTDLEVRGPTRMDVGEQRFWALMSPDGKQVVTWGWGLDLGSDKGRDPVPPVEASLWSLETAGPPKKLGGSARAVAWSKDSALIAIGRKGVVEIFDATTGERVCDPVVLEGDVNDLAFHPREPVVAVGAAAGASGPRLFLIDTDIGQVTREIEPPGFDSEGVCWVEFNPSGESLAVGVGQIGSAHVFETSSGNPRWSVFYDGGNPSTLFVRFDAAGGRVLIHGQTDLTTRWVDALTGELLVDGSGAWCGPFGISPAGDIVTRGNDVLEADTLKLRYRRHEFRDGGYVLLAPSGHYDGTPDAIRNAWVSVGGQPWPLDCFDRILHDPEIVGRATVGAGAVPSPSLPTPPQIVVAYPLERAVRVDDGGQVSASGSGFAPIQIQARSPSGITQFEIEPVGGTGGTKIVAASESGTSPVELSWIVPTEWRQEAVDLRIRARSVNGTRSKALLVALRPNR